LSSASSSKSIIYAVNEAGEESDMPQISVELSTPNGLQMREPPPLPARTRTSPPRDKTPTSSTSSSSKSSDQVGVSFKRFRFSINLKVELLTSRQLETIVYFHLRALGSCIRKQQLQARILCLDVVVDRISEFN
jgi:hypothetical protein